MHSCSLVIYNMAAPTHRSHITSSPRPQPHRDPKFRSDWSSSMPTARLYPDRGGGMCDYFTIWRRDPLETFSPLGGKVFALYRKPIQWVSWALLYHLIEKETFYDILVQISKQFHSLVGYHSGEADLFYLYMYIFIYSRYRSLYSSLGKIQTLITKILIQ